MRLKIDNSTHTFIPIQAFRVQWSLPEEFGLTYFEPKDWQGLGSIEGTGPLLAHVKQQVVQTVPTTLTLPQLMSAVELLAQTFQHHFTAANSQIGLRLVEVDFAVAGFHDVLQTVAYQLVQLAHTYGAHTYGPAQITHHLDFEAMYQAWLDDSVRVSTTLHHYDYQGITFKLYVVNNAYGRVGLKVHTGSNCYYVMDTSLACPAANYIKELCRDVTLALVYALAW